MFTTGFSLNGRKKFFAQFLYVKHNKSIKNCIYVCAQHISLDKVTYMLCYPNLSLLTTYSERIIHIDNAQSQSFNVNTNIESKHIQVFVFC